MADESSHTSIYTLRRAVGTRFAAMSARASTARSKDCNMTRLIKFAACVAAFSALATPVLAQSSATQSTTGSVTIVQSLQLAKNTDLAFGSVVRPTSGTNTVAIDAASGARAMTGGGDAALAPSTSGRATYTVTGEGGQTFSISTPTSFDMQRQGGSDTVTVALAQSAATGTLNGALGATGTATFGVGGSFDVSSTTASGAYSGTFDVTVAYN